MKFKLQIQAVVLLVLVVISIFSCNKNNNPVTSTKIAADSSSYYQLQVATLASSDIVFKQTTYNGFIGGNLVKICVYGNKLGFLVPEIAAGSYYLQTTIEGNQCVININITALPTIADPNALIQATLLKCIPQNSYLDSLVRLTASMQGTVTANDDANLSNLKNGNSQVASTISTSTASDKVYLAKIITANPSLFYQLQNALTYIDTNRLFRTAATDFEQNTDNNLINATNYLSIDNRVLLITNAILATPAQPNAILPFITGVISNRAFDALKTAVIMFNEPVINSGNVIAKYYKGTSSNITANNNQLYTLELNGAYRNLYALDSNSQEPLIMGFNTALSYFSNIWNSLKTVLPSPLVGNSVSFSNMVNTKTKLMPVNAKYLSVNNITNPNVTATYDNSTSLLKVKFSTSQTTIQNFSFDVLYNNTDVDTLRQTFTGTLIMASRSGVIVAGGNGIGSANNQLYGPAGIWIDGTGNLFVSDQINNRVMKWAPGVSSGIVVAGGNGSGGGYNQLYDPAGICLDRNGGIYIADQSNNRIIKWAHGATTGTVMAGFASGGYDSTLSRPSSVYVDNSGIIYAADAVNSRIQKWVPGLGVFTAAGGFGFGMNSNQLYNPGGVFVDAMGNIYIADTYNNRIQKWAPGTLIGLTVAGGNGAGSAANQMANPSGLYVDATGNIYVADKDNRRIQKWVPGATEGINVATGDCNGVFLDASGNIYVLNVSDVSKWPAL